MASNQFLSSSFSGSGPSSLGTTQAINSTNFGSVGGGASSSFKPSTSIYTPDYASITDILAQNKKVPCKFLQTVQKLGFIDPASDCEDVPEGTCLELPLWLAETLHEKHLVTIMCPKGYNQTFREILEADATVVDLHKLGPDYYKFGEHLVKMNIPESEEIAKSMINTFHQRVHKIMDFALSAAENTSLDGIIFESYLDNSEKELFKIGKQSTKDFKSWEHCLNEKLTANEMVTNIKKRKRAIMLSEMQ